MAMKTEHVFFFFLFTKDVLAMQYDGTSGTKKKARYKKQKRVVLFFILFLLSSAKRSNSLKIRARKIG